MKLHMAGLQNKMEGQSQHSADACIIMATCSDVTQSSCLLLRRSYILTTTADNSSVFNIIFWDI